MTPTPTIRQVLAYLAERIQLWPVAGGNGSDHPFPSAWVQEEALCRSLNFIRPSLFQIVAEPEGEYLASLGVEVRAELLRRVLDHQIVAVVLIRDVEPPPCLLEFAEATGTPLFRSADPEGRLRRELTHHLTRLFSERAVPHGVFMEVFGEGVLLQGASSIGKSELALELISRGHRLVADDTPEFVQTASGELNGTCPIVLQDFLEVRGLGLINVRRLFGDGAIKPRKNLQLIVRLERMDSDRLRNIDRLRGAYRCTEVMGVMVSEVTIPVTAGRELAVLVETAVRQHIQRVRGYDGAEEFIDRQQRHLTSDGLLPV